MKPNGYCLCNAAMHTVININNSIPHFKNIFPVKCIKLTPPKNKIYHLQYLKFSVQSCLRNSKKESIVVTQNGSCSVLASLIMTIYLYSIQVLHSELTLKNSLVETSAPLRPTFMNRIGDGI